MRSIENHGMSDEAAYGRAAGFGESCRRGFLVGRLAQANLDQFVLIERFVQGLRDCGAQARFSDEDDGFERVGERAESTSLGTVQAGGGLRDR